jgi:mono/diheme cytochrome c family protein
LRQRPKTVLLLLLVPLVAVLGYVGWAVWDGGPPSPRTVVVPELSPTAREGAEAFDRRCAECHGRHAAGTAVGPPLVHPIYRPAHHADVAFALAVQRGVAAHHWRFPDMPPQPGMPPGEIDKITRYVRELQRANGVE